MDKPSSHFLTGIGPNKNTINNNNNINNDSKKLMNNCETIGGDNYAVPYSHQFHQTQQHDHQQQQQQDISEQCNVQYQENSSDKAWKIEDVECKREIDLMPNDNYLDNPNNSDDMNLNYGPAVTDSYNETFNKYGYNTNNNNNNNNSQINNSNNSRNTPFYEGGANSSNSHRNNNIHQNPHLTYRSSINNTSTYSPYQMSPSTKSQLPAWYHPPQHPPHQNQDLPPPPPAAVVHPSYYPSQNFFQPHHQPYQVNYMASATTSSDHNMRNMIQMTNR